MKTTVWKYNRIEGLYVAAIIIFMGAYIFIKAPEIVSDMEILSNVTIFRVLFLAGWAIAGAGTGSTYFVLNEKYVFDEYGITKYNFKNDELCSNLWTDENRSYHVREGAGKARRSYLLIRFSNENEYRIPWGSSAVTKLSELVNIEEAKTGRQKLGIKLSVITGIMIVLMYFCMH